MQRDGRIDGWRGAAVLLVIVGHLIEFRFRAFTETDKLSVMIHDHSLTVTTALKYALLKFIAPLQNIGVDIFFIISGFLITSLLLKEERARGAISIPAFYVRRVCRILPAFYVFLFVMFVLWSAGRIHLPATTFALSATFLFDLWPDWASWWVGHSWSLAVEEQFYLVWPLAFAVLGTRYRTMALATLLAGLVLFSEAHYLTLSFAHIATGALVALSDRAKSWIESIATWPIIALAAGLVLIQPVFIDHLEIHATLEAITPLLLAIVFFGSIWGRGPFVALISMDWLRRVGLVSYSVYLWQQLWTAKPELLAANTILYLPILLIIPALLSYTCIERPMIKLGHRLSDSIAARAPPL